MCRSEGSKDYFIKYTHLLDTRHTEQMKLIQKLLLHASQQLLIIISVVRLVLRVLSYVLVACEDKSDANHVSGH